MTHSARESGLEMARRINRDTIRRNVLACEVLSGAAEERDETLGEYVDRRMVELYGEQTHDA